MDAQHDVLNSDRPRKHTQLKRLILTRDFVATGWVDLDAIRQHFGNTWSTRTHRRDLEVLIDLGFVEPFDLMGRTHFRRTLRTR
jgi:hypothetical protein